MSGILKAIGKVFKGIVKVAKKIVLPVLAVGAAVLTGGASLGILPALSAGGGLGLSAGLASVISTAGTGALMGGLTSAITGGNILKGMTVGAAMGAGTNLIGMGLGQAPMHGLGWGKPTTGLASATGGGANAGTSIGTEAAGLAANDPLLSSFDKTFGVQTPASTMPTSSVAATVSPVASVSSASSSIAPAAAASTIAQAARPTMLSGFGQLFRDPTFMGSMVQGLGAGFSSAAQAKAEREIWDAKFNADKEAAAQRSANYNNTTGFYSATGPSPYQPNLVAPNERWRAAMQPGGRWVIDPITGKPYQEKATG